MGEYLVNGLYDYLMLEEDEERRFHQKQLERKKAKALRRQMELKQ